jgi:hypothetical protein
MSGNVTMAEGLAKHVPAWLSAATADKAMAFIVAGAVLLVVILLARAVGRLSKAAALPPPVPESGGYGKFVLAAAAAIGALLLWSRHENAAPAKTAARPSAPSPSPTPSPQPVVTQAPVPRVTVTPHVTSTAHHFLLTGGDIVALYIIAAVVAIVLVGQALRRSS